MDGIGMWFMCASTSLYKFRLLIQRAECKIASSIVLSHSEHEGRVSKHS